MARLERIALLPPGAALARAHGDEWDFPDHLVLLHAREHLDGLKTHAVWRIAELAEDRPVTLFMGTVAVADVRLREFQIVRMGFDWGDSDPACLVRLEKVLNPSSWARTCWSSIPPGQTLYLWLASDAVSRGSVEIGTPPWDITWPQLDDAFETGNIELVF